MLRAAILEAVREEVRNVLSDAPTPEAVLRDVGFLLAALPPEDALTFARVAIMPLADFINARMPDDEPDIDTTGAEGTGEEE